MIQRPGEWWVGEDQAVSSRFARVVLGERIPINDMRTFYPVQHHVHRPDAEHGAVEIEAVEHRLVEMFAQFRVAQHFGMPAPQVLTDGDQETAGASGRIADDVRRLWLRQLDHQRNNVPRRAELPVLPGSRDLAEHVLVDITLGVAIVHPHIVELLHRLSEQRRRRNAEARVLHVLAESRTLPAERAQEREHVLVNDCEHLARLEGFEPRPAQILVGAAALILTLRKNPPLHFDLELRGLPLLDGMELIETLDEQKVSDLFDHGQRVRHSARPEIVPDTVNLRPDLPC